MGLPGKKLTFRSHNFYYLLKNNNAIDTYLNCLHIPNSVNLWIQNYLSNPNEGIYMFLMLRDADTSVTTY